MKKNRSTASTHVSTHQFSRSDRRRRLQGRALLPLLLVILPAAGLLTAAAPSQVRAKSLARAAASLPAKPAADTFQTELAPLVRKYCAGCHGDKNPTAGLSLTHYKTTATVLKDRSVWEKVSRNIASGHMPPMGLPQPAAAEKNRMLAWIDGTLSKADCQLKDPGRVTMRRLNREEYNNTIRDLFGVLNLRPADIFPSDDVGYGFDNIGDVLSISPLLMEKYLSAAEKVAQAVIIAPENISEPVRYLAGSLPESEGTPFESGRLLASVGEIGAEHDFPREGDYVLRAELFGQQAGAEPARVAFRIDGKDVHTLDVKAVDAAPEVYETRVKVPAGKHRFAVAFLNDYYKPDAANPNDRDRNLVVNFLEVQGPLGWQGPLPLSHQRLISVKPSATVTRDDAARKILAPFARRAFRRPVTKSEVERLVRYVGLSEQQGESFERGIQLAVEAALCSPNFLFRVEVDKNPNDPKAKHPVGQYEMANRLSYFLWSSMPDEELFQLAAQNKLQDPQVLAAQVRRMLKDSRAKALADNFGAQWLTLRRLANVSPARRMFPEWNDRLRQAMRTETLMFFQEVVKQDRSLLDFLDGRFTYLNEPLAKLYGIQGVTGDQFRRVVLTSNQRCGILTQASILTVTSNPTRTSPVKRGKWVLEQLLGTPPPPPPPNVPKLADDRGNRRRPLEGTLRQRMEQHRKDPMCASCHAPMDPIGFGLENFDAIGRWREKDGTAAVDSSGQLPGGKRFNGPVQLIQILKAKQPQFARCLTEKMLTYALGRGLETYDNCNVGAIVQRLARDNYRFSSLITEVVQSEPFRERRGDGGKT